MSLLALPIESDVSVPGKPFSAPRIRTLELVLVTLLGAQNKQTLCEYNCQG